MAHASAGEQQAKDSPLLLPSPAQGRGQSELRRLPTSGPFAPVADVANAMLAEPEGTAPREIVVSPAPGQTNLVRCVRVKTGAVLTIEDITAVEYQKRLESWAPVAQKLAHGIKNPLNTILGSVEQIELKVEDEKVKKYMGYVKDEVTRLRKMSDAFMRFTKLNPPALEPKNINDVIGKVIAKFEGRMADKVGLKQELDEKLPAIALDEEGLGNALEIVIENALEAMASESKGQSGARERPGTLKIRTALAEKPASSGLSAASAAGPAGGPGGESVLIEISDTGKGIPQKYLEKVFDPYFTFGKPNGTGLGLALAKKIVEDHHGRIEVHSIEGQGTEVDIYLPVKI
jgi:nitrogen fixation/metabolism regulation signal transduction histidine kinase